jgi:ABC-type transport system involved in multi-copper enzyme maturation permease subunit
MIQRIAAVALGTYRESVRDKIFYLVAIFGFVLIGSFAVLSPLTLGVQGKIVTDVGLGSLTMFGLLAVVFIGSGMVRKEIDRHTITTVLAKPVTRREYLFGKYFGLSLTVVCMLAIMMVLFVVTALLVRTALDVRYLAAFYLAMLELLLLTGAVLLFATFLSPILAAVMTLCVFVIGHLSQDLLSFGRLLGGGWQLTASTVLYFIIPNLEVFNVRGAVVHGDAVGGDHVLWATLYAFCYTGLLLLIAGAIFTRRELK